MDYQKLQTVLAADPDYTAIVNAPFMQSLEASLLYLGITVLLIHDTKTGLINRVALSNTELAQNTTTVSAVPFNEIKIPLTDSDNIIARAISTGQSQQTTDWTSLFTPALTADEARLNQSSAGIAYSAVYPLVNNRAIIFSFYQQDSQNQTDFMQRYVELLNRVS